MSIAAHWARVAVPYGTMVVSVTPVIMPHSTARAIAASAQSLTLEASAKSVRAKSLAGSPE